MTLSQFHTDSQPTTVGVDKVDKLRLYTFLQDVLRQELPKSMGELTRLLQSMRLATDKGVLNLAGVLIFTERPELLVPQFIATATRYLGNERYVGGYTHYKEFSGPLQKVFDDALAFIMGYLHKIQAGRGVNSPGLPEVPPSIFEALLINALVHRNYLIHAPIQIFIFENRVEIISPGHLPGDLTVKKIKAGETYTRNPILASYIAKGLLPYSSGGIKRALKNWPDIEFVDDREEYLFTTRGWRPGITSIAQGCRIDTQRQKSCSLRLKTSYSSCGVSNV